MGSSPSQWRHVDSKSNPADDVSRGQTATEMIDNKRWLQGPSFLWLDESDWPKSPFLRDLKDEDPEVKTKKDVVTIYATSKLDQTSVVDMLLERRSSWHNLKKDVAWLLRVKEYLRSKANKLRTPDMQKQLTVDEMSRSEDSIIKYIQQRSFSDELKCLQTNKGIGKTSSVFKLDPVLSADGIVRVGGRLKNAPVNEQVKSPVLLPKDHHVVFLIVRHFHQASGHSGRGHVLSLLRQRFWLIGARSTVLRALRDCFVCKRLSATPIEQKMADLPQDRVTPNKPPFSYVGVDCFGPFMVKQGRSLVKRYGCIFTCLVVRAVHIEILHSLEADSFINGFQRFMCRRGQPEEMRSDNGSNFVGAERELRESMETLNKQISGYLLQKGVRWKFNPPTASHMGGVWERQIRTTRKLMNSLMKEQTMPDESLSTLMCLVESIINGRPITTVSDDVNDMEPLTPNHLLLLRAGVVLPAGIFDKKDLYGRKRWRQVQYMVDVFWRRWIGEYLPTLHERQKWSRPQRNVQVGDVILVVDNDLPRNKWLFGRIIETYPGKDQLVRAAKVKTRSATLMRPVQKLCLLETVERMESANTLKAWRFFLTLHFNQRGLMFFTIEPCKPSIYHKCLF